MTLHDERAPEQLSALLTERAADITATPDLLVAVRSRARRSRRTRWLAGGAALLMVVLAAAVTISATTTSGRGTARVTAPVAGFSTSPSLAPAFPLTPTSLPSGLLPARTVMVAGVTELRYDSAVTTEPTVAVTIEVGSTTPADVGLDDPAVAVTVKGRPATILSVSSAANTLLFTREPGQVVAITGQGTYAATTDLLELAGSLTDVPVPATPPFDIPDVPASVGALIAYDADSLQYGLSPTTPALTVTFAAGIDRDPTAPTVASSSPVAQVDLHRSDGLLQLTSSTLSVQELLDLAPHVTVQGGAGHVVDTAPTDLPDSTVLTASSVPSAPTTAPPSPGSQPADPTDAADAVRAAFHTAFTAEPAGEPYASLAVVEGGDRLHATLDQLRANFPQAAGTITVTTGAVVFTSPTTAVVPFTIAYTGGAPYGTKDGDAVLVGGAWLVSRSTYCDLMAFGGAECPAE